MIDTQTKTHKKSKSDSCHCAEPKPDGACCELICFERPNYFCGHLLTDADLSTEQRYGIEKRKLHNRALHGWGVVCGLRLTCDDECGGIMIDEGYAIDDCGNDLVVCQPLRFDVIGKLREKRYLVGDVAYDPCKPTDEQDECEIRECFYVTICYEEEPREFTTPFVAGCRPSLTECEPTRIREGVRFDVLNELPTKHDWLEDLECRIEHCAKLFTEGQFAKALNDNLSEVSDAVNGRATPNKKWWDLFCTLSQLLLLYVTRHPDKYNCTLKDEIRRIPFPDPKTDKPDPTRPRSELATAEERYREGRTYLGENYGGDVSAAFCRLLELAHQHVMSCVLGELLVTCKEPCQPACVVLGTVEVIGEKVVRVCNCPRSYVWSFGSFWEVAIATLLGGQACDDTPHGKMKRAPRHAHSVPTVSERGEFGRTDTLLTGESFSGVSNTAEPRPGRTDSKEELEEEFKRICCSDAPFDCVKFVSDLQINQKAIYDGTTSALDMFTEVRKALRYAFDFTRTDILSASAFKNMYVERASDLAQANKVNLIIEDQPLEQQQLDPIQAFLSSTLSGAERPIYAYQSQGRILETRSEWRPEAFLARAEKRVIDAQISDLRNEVRSLRGDLEKAREMVEKMSRFRQEVKEGLEGAQKRAAKKRPTRRRGLGPQEGGKNG